MISGLRYEAERRKKQDADAKAAEEAAAHGVSTAAAATDENLGEGSDSKS
jgi:hypothetical protein